LAREKDLSGCCGLEINNECAARSHDSGEFSNAGVWLAIIYDSANANREIERPVTEWQFFYVADNRPRHCPSLPKRNVKINALAPFVEPVVVAAAAGVKNQSTSLCEVTPQHGANEFRGVNAPPIEDGPNDFGLIIGGLCACPDVSPVTEAVHNP